MLCRMGRWSAMLGWGGMGLGCLQPRAPRSRAPHGAVSQAPARQGVSVLLTMPERLRAPGDVRVVLTVPKEVLRSRTGAQWMVVALTTHPDCTGSEMGSLVWCWHVDEALRVYVCSACYACTELAAWWMITLSCETTVERMMCAGCGVWVASGGSVLVQPAACICGLMHRD